MQSRKVILCLFFSCFALLLRAQIPVGHWRTHLSYSNITQIAETPEKVYGVSDGALFSYDKDDQSVDVITKVEGLNDTKVQLIAYSKETFSLVIIYDNSNIDILNDNGTIFNIPDIKNKNMSEGKTVNSIFLIDKRVYLSMGYGISVIDLKKREVSESYTIGNTFSTHIINNQLFAAKTNSITTASLTSNLVDPRSWSEYNGLQVNHLTSFQNRLIGSNSSGTYIIERGQQRAIYNGAVNGIIGDNSLLVAYNSQAIVSFKSDFSFTITPISNLNQLAASNPSNEIWAASATSGINKLTKMENGFQYIELGIKPSGPVSNSPYKLKFSGEKLMVVAGGAWHNRFNTPGAIFFFENEKWDYVKVDTIDVPDGARDFIDIVEDPKVKDHYYVASWGEGLYEFQNKKLVKLHALLNSPLESVFANSPNYLRIGSLLFDKNGNLFMSNSWSNFQYKILGMQQQWSSLFYNQLVKVPNLFNLIQTKPGVFWATSARFTPGLFVFDPKLTFANQNDDQSVFFEELEYLDNLEIKKIKPNNYFSIAEDKNGAIWVGTDIGPIVFNNPSKVFEPNFTCSRIKIARNDGTQLADYLLENEQIRAIAVDGSNRKWLGTENSGIYLVSDNGQQTIHHFTAENSPLLSNKILSIAVHPTTGEVFIGTDKGLISYRGDAIEGKMDYNEVRTFPNPVRSDYTGLITVTGLRYNSTVRITDTVGNSIYEGISEGGQFTWNGRNRQGEKVATGVYLVYAATSDATDGVVSKILVVK